MARTLHTVGSNAYLTATDLPNWNNLSDFSFSCWFVLFDELSDITLISRDAGFLIEYESQTSELYSAPVGKNLLLEFGKWYHFVVTSSSSPACSDYYINGVSYLSYDVSASSGSGSIYINGTLNVAGGWAELGFWNRALTPAEIAALYAYGYTSVTGNNNSGLVYSYRLNGTGLTELEDRGGPSLTIAGTNPTTLIYEDSPSQIRESIVSSISGPTSYGKLRIPATYADFYESTNNTRQSTLSGLAGYLNGTKSYSNLVFDCTDVISKLEDLYGAAPTPDNFIITGASLVFYNKNAQNSVSGTVQISSIPGRDTHTQSLPFLELSDRMVVTNKDQLAVLTPSSESKTKSTIELLVDANSYTNALFLSPFLSRSDLSSYTVPLPEGVNFLNLSIIPNTVTGNVGFEVGGLTLAQTDGSDWRTASSEPTDPPVLELEYLYLSPDMPSLGMYYTTTEPTTAQATPANSLGGYKSFNPVYTTTWITNPIDTSDTEVNVDTAPTESSGLVQVGPEIASYASVSGKTLQGLVRGVSPAALPATVNPVADQVRYIDVDGLFSTNPVEQQPQYRCIALSNDGEYTNAVAADRYTSSLVLSVLQKGTSDVQVSVAVEVPAHDSHSGVHSGVAGAAQITDSTSFVTFDPNPANGKYDDAAVIINNDTSRIAIINHFSYNSGTSTATITFKTAVSLSLNETYVILPAASQVTVNDRTSPSVNARLSEFGTSVNVSLSDHAEKFWKNDIIYVWVKRSFTVNAAEDSDTGAVLAVKHTPPNEPAGYTSKILGIWDFDQTAGDRYSENNFDRSSGLNSFSVISRYSLTNNLIETVYGLEFEDGITWTAGSDFNFRTSASTYGFNVDFWWHSPAALGRIRNVITREVTNKIAPILAKADVTASGGLNVIVGEWIICEVGVSETQNAIRLYLCANGTSPTHMLDSEPYDPGLHNVYVFFSADAGNGIASVEIDGKPAGYRIGPSVIPQTSTQLRLNSVGFGPVAHNTVQEGAVINELVVRSNYIGIGDSTRFTRYGWDFTTSASTFFDEYGFVGIGFHQPSTVSTSSIVSNGSNIVVARSDGEILLGKRPAWDVEHTFDDAAIIPFLRAQNPQNVAVEGSKLIVTGTSIRIP